MTSDDLLPRLIESLDAAGVDRDAPRSADVVAQERCLTLFLHG